MKYDVKDVKGNKVEQIDLNDAVFGCTPNEHVLAQYLRVYLANQRQGTSSTKTRGEVSGGGKKPWAQKHTGRARAGSSRNPLWRHGGVAHGPKPRDWHLDLPAKVKKAATISALSQKFLAKSALILNELRIKEPQTKQIVELLKKLNLTGKTLFVTISPDVNLLKSLSNVKTVTGVTVGTLNAHDLMATTNIVFVKDAVKSLEEKYA